MKRFIISLFATIAIAVSSFAQSDPEEPIPFPIVAQGDVGIPIFRAPSLVVIQGYYVPNDNTLYFIFNCSIGDVLFYIENINTGDNHIGLLSSEHGIDSVILDGTPGTYYVQLLTYDGRLYYGEFVV